MMREAMEHFQRRQGLSDMEARIANILAHHTKTDLIMVLIRNLVAEFKEQQTIKAIMTH